MTKTTRYYPADLPEDLGNSPSVVVVLTLLRDMGFEICKPREECDVHPGQPAACYVCL